MNNATWFNENAIKIWMKYSSLQKYAPLLIPDIDDEINFLLIGMNPSHRINWNSKKIKANPNIFGDETIESLLDWNVNITKDKIKKIIALENLARKEDKQYYKSLSNFSNSCGEKKWTHIDTFLCRKTKQEEMLKDVFNGNELNEFGKAQVTLLKEFIYKLKPKKIVVLNAKASLIFQKYIANDESNKSMIKMDGIIVYFAGMLSGQRCMDRYSQYRLIESIKST